MNLLKLKIGLEPPTERISIILKRVQYEENKNMYHVFEDKYYNIPEYNLFDEVSE
jgi:hypothetical protein